MGRRRLAVGEHGQIKVTQLAPKHHRARCEVRCRDGQIRSVQADGPSKTAATDAVKARAAERAEAAGRRTPGADAPTLTPTTTLAVLADRWFEEKKASSEVAPQSLHDYEHYVNLVQAGLGELRIAEVTTGTFEWFIKTEAGTAASKAKNLLRTLSGMMSLAIRHDAFGGENPANEVVVVKADPKAPRALTIDELKAYRECVRLWMAGPVDEDGQPIKRGGRQRSQDLLDIVDMQLATGARISEVLALRWSDVDLNTEKPTAHIGGTLVPLPGGRANGGGLVRQEHRKAKDRYSVVLPRFAVATLLRLKTSAKKNPNDAIFPSATGTWRSPTNLRTQLRAARGTQWKWVQPHTFRKTVGTLIEREHGLEAASRQLGHAGTAVTARHYIERAVVAPDASATLDRLGPRGA